MFWEINESSASAVQNVSSLTFSSLQRPLDRFVFIAVAITDPVPDTYFPPDSIPPPFTPISGRLKRRLITDFHTFSSQGYGHQLLMTKQCFKSCDVLILQMLWLDINIFILSPSSLFPITAACKKLANGQNSWPIYKYYGGFTGQQYSEPIR